MLRTNCISRVVWVKELQVEKRQGENGTYDSKSILFRVATDRNYRRTVVKDGQQIKEKITDFILCRANGALAQLISDTCSETDANGKIKSRHLYLTGHLETYRSPQKFKIEQLPVNVNGTTYNLNFETEQDVNNFIFIVDELEFLDKKPVAETEKAAPQATVAVAVQPQAQTTAPVVQVNQQAPAQTVNTAPAISPHVSPYVNVPVVPAGYTGAEAPY